MKSNVLFNLICIFHSGEAGVGIADLISYAISFETGKSISEARKNIYLVDSKGLVTKSRFSSLQSHKRDYAHDVDACPDLLTAINVLKPTALIGVSAVPKSFTEEICRKMAELNRTPIIFALSNPTSKAECTPHEAYSWTEGRAVFASGSPFAEVNFKSRVITPGQGNNAYVFPGIGLGAMASGATKITQHDMYVAAKALASLVSEDQISKGCVYPSLSGKILTERFESFFALFSIFSKT